MLEFVELCDSIAMLNHQAKIDSDIYVLQLNDSKRKKAKLIKTQKGYSNVLILRYAAMQAFDFHCLNLDRLCWIYDILKIVPSMVIKAKGDELVKVQ